jgi:hypothetical protein
MARTASWQLLLCAVYVLFLDTLQLEVSHISHRQSSLDFFPDQRHSKSSTSFIS